MPSADDPARRAPGSGSNGAEGKPSEPAEQHEEEAPAQPVREVPIGVPVDPERFRELKRAAERPDPPEDEDAQQDQPS